MEQRFAGKVAMVTGAALGIGAAIATRLRAEGAKVAALDIEEGALHDAFGDDPDVFPLVCDVSSCEQVADAVACVVERFGRIDVLMNNAGINTKSINDEYSMLKCPPEAFRRVFETNTFGAFYVGQAVARQMVAQGGGVIVNTCSNTAFETFPNGGGYGPSKAALVKMTMIWAKELMPLGVRVNGFAPGTTKTRFTEKIWGDEKTHACYVERMPIGRLGTPEESAAVACFLASDDASFVVGEVYELDGGQHL